MGLASFAVRNRATTYFVVLVVAIAGLASFFGLGQLEDPEFTVKTAVITTLYPGASPEEVELEVTDRIEIALQELPQLDYIESWSSPGQSLISIDIKAKYWSDALPQVWDEMRRKINDVLPSLPPGVQAPVITDDFGDVFGFQLAVIGDGFTHAELESRRPCARSSGSWRAWPAPISGVRSNASSISTCRRHSSPSWG
ncbi:MAG: efflux RND transporter permease subunit [Planctomycetota bacterium]|jgi:multidrug efflux pump subunit AcrB